MENKLRVKSIMLVVASLIGITVLCGAVLSATIVNAEGENEGHGNNLSVVIPISCIMSGTVDTTHSASLQLGTYSGASGSPYANGIGKTTLTTFCTDKNGFAIYAIGNTNNVEGTNTMVGTTSGATINTKAYESTDTVSNWAMKVTKVTDSSESYNPQNMSILDNYDSWHAVPSTFTKVAQYKATTGSSVTDDLLGAKVETTYAVYVSTDQTPDSYTGQVKYVLVHPYNGVSPDTNEYTTTVTLGTNITKITFTSDITEPQSVKTSGDTVSLYDGVTYTITATTEDGYELASWTTDQYGTIGNATQNPTTFTATGATTLSATAQEQLPEHTCTKEYRLQNADGTYPATYTSDGTETLRQGSTCTYTKSVENYQTQEYTATMITDQTISLDLPRNTYELTVNKDNTNITTVTGAGTYRWGETVNISATPATGSRFTTWTQTSGTTSTFADATSATTTFTMPISAATITATGEPIPSYNVTVTLDTNTTSVSFTNATYGTQNITTSGDTASLRSGVEYIITATTASGYEFSSWTPGSGATLGSATANPTTLVITSATTLSASSKVDTPEPQPATAGCINYFANASTAVGTMGCQSATDGQSKTLLASNFSRTGYGFAGWSDSYDYATNPNAKFYGPQETITVPTGTTANGLSLYAVWVKSQGSIQDQSKVASVCNSLTTAPTDGTANLTSVSALTDQRDNNTYAIAKLADGKCWMIENLRLESTNSDNTTGALAQGYGTSATYGNFGGLADAESTNFSNSTTANSLYYSGTQEGTASIDIGTSDYPGYRMPRYNNWNNQATSVNRPQNPTTNSATNSTTNAGMYSYGNYYTWHAAIADLTYNGTNNQSTTGTSLCPTGWRLPQGGNKTRIESNDDNDFWNLAVDALNGGTNPANYDSSAYPFYTGTAEAGPVADKLRSYPNNFLYSGLFYTSSTANRGSLGNYWSSTAYNNYDSYYLYLYSSDVFPGTLFDNKYGGRSIRCTAGSSTPAPTTETVTVSLDSNVTSVTFSDGMSPDQTVTTNGGTVNLTPNTSYTITATTASGYEFSSWTAGANATLGSTTTNPTTLTVTGTTTLSATSQQIPSYNVTVTLDTDTTSVGFYNATYGTQNITTSGDTASIRSGVEYTITATTASGYEFSSWTVGTNATLGSATANPTTLTVTGATTLSATSREEGTGPQPATAGCVNYFANASTAVGTMGCQSATDGNSVTLLASNFSRTGYGFAGWSDSYDYAANPNAKFYGPMETITVPTGTTANGLSLYAVWIKSQGSIQDQSKVASVCNSLTTAPTDGTANLTSVSALTDQRDNNTYAIAKLADGKCWMIENLRLESTAEHNTDGTLAEGYGTSATYGNFGGLADVENSGFSSTYTANSLYYSGTQEGTASIDIGTANLPAYRMPRYNNWNNQATSANRPQNPTTNSATNSTTNAGMYSYGNYYTWHAAIADLTYNGTNNQSTTGTSLCPAGWHLPKGGNNQNTANNEFLAFSEALIGAKPAEYDSQTYPSYTGTPEGSDASNKLRAYPNNFLYSGHFSASSTQYRGSRGYYWSSTAGNDYYSYLLYLTSSNVYPGTIRSYELYGQSIRCTAGS